MPTLGTFGAAAARGFGLTSGVSLIPINITISANTSNYVLDTSKAAGYVAGKSFVTLTIDNGVIVSSSSTGSYALTVDTSWAAGDRVTIVNNGVILGRGGNGGSGNPGAGGAGAGGGPALLVQRAISLNNVNRIAGGGGGGGGGGGFTTSKGEQIRGAGGGGGIGVSSGGTGRFPGNAGTLTTAGTGGNIETLGVGRGGDGGTYGTSGNNGQASPQTGNPGGSGAAAGAAIVGNSDITYINTGTINGSIS